ncbi:family 88 glycosyl hydrolase [Sphingobacteriaceae bacterium]|nr:family 88 glycosyl hydrolase [Sphingobacteriaceae bacterium]
MKKIILLSAFAASFTYAHAQYTSGKGNDVTSPLHLMKPDYVTPYSAMSKEDIKKVIDRVYAYLDAVTPAQMVNKQTNEVVSDILKLDTNTIVQPGDYRLTSYEWGVTYSAFLRATETTSDKKYSEYVKKRFDFLATWVPPVKKLVDAGKYKTKDFPLHQPIAPHALDDAGAVCAAMIKATNAGLNTNLRPLIDNYIAYVATKEYRLADGTLARNRPQKNTLWLDDLYMGVPAIANMGKLTNEKKYFDDAVNQLKLFTERMFNKEKGLYMHGWVEGMEQHPQFHWGRANGWAILTMVELLDVLPENHEGRPYVLSQLKAHAKGLASYQSGFGFWHQLLDREDSYLETSATAIYAYCFAHAINKGWLDAKAYAPAAMLAWNAVATKVNDKGQVEGTCVGTGMAFDPAFYYYRPVNVFAAHGYGPVIMAGAEMYELMKTSPLKLNDSSIQYYKDK